MWSVGVALVLAMSLVTPVGVVVVREPVELGIPAVSTGDDASVPAGRSPAVVDVPDPDVGMSSAGLRTVAAVWPSAGSATVDISAAQKLAVAGVSVGLAKSGAQATAKTRPASVRVESFDRATVSRIGAIGQVFRLSRA